MKFLFRVTLRRHDLAAEVYHLKEPQKLPLVMSPEEANRLLAMSDNLKVHVMLALGYGCGLRAGEIVRLRVGDIDSVQMIIRIVQWKGRKDRHVMLPPEVLSLLREWWKARPTRYDAGVPVRSVGCFPGADRRVPHDAPVQSPFPRDGRRSRHHQARESAFAAPLLCNASAR